MIHETMAAFQGALDELRVAAGPPLPMWGGVGSVNYKAGTINAFPTVDGLLAAILIPTMYIDYLSATWQELRNSTRPEDVALVIQIRIAMTNEEVWYPVGDDRLVLPAYRQGEPSTAFAPWRSTPHTITVEAWLDNAEEDEVAPVEQLLGGVTEAGYSVVKNPYWWNKEKGERVAKAAFFEATAPMAPIDEYGLPVWSNRGVPVDAFELTTRRVDGGGAGEGFSDLARGAEQAMEAYLAAIDEQTAPDERARAQGIMTSLTGSQNWIDANGKLRSSPGRARMTSVTVAGTPYRWTAQAPVITAAEILAAKPRRQAS